MLPHIVSPNAILSHSTMSTYCPLLYCKLSIGSYFFIVFLSAVLRLYLLLLIGANTKRHSLLRCWFVYKTRSRSTIISNMALRVYALVGGSASRSTVPFPQVTYFFRCCLLVAFPFFLSSAVLSFYRVAHIRDCAKSCANPIQLPEEAAALLHCAWI